MHVLLLARQFCTKPKIKDLFHKIQRKSHTELINTGKIISDFPMLWSTFALR